MTTAGAFGTIPVVTTESTYALVAASVGLTTEPSSVIMFVAKLPEPSRTTISPGISSLEIFANLSLVIVPLVISASVTNDVEIFPEASLCKTPGEVKELICKFPLTTSSCVDRVPLIVKLLAINSVTDKLLMHKVSMQLATAKSVTERDPTTASVTEKVFTVISPTERDAMIASAAERVPLILTLLLNVAFLATSNLPLTCMPCFVLTCL